MGFPKPSSGRSPIAASPADGPAERGVAAAVSDRRASGQAVRVAMCQEERRPLQTDGQNRLKVGALPQGFRSSYQLLRIPSKSSRGRG